MKKLINRPESVVEEMIDGLALAWPNLQRLPGLNVLIRSEVPIPENRPVAVISGGGSGHEPAHAGYVGRGMLTAAVAGDVFTSPTPDSVLAAIRATAGPNGALLVVKNYTGDRLNFGLAAELARAYGIPVELVLVADDVALADTVGPEGRRGLAGTILVHKVAGATAEAGGSLSEVVANARSVADAVRTMGVGLTSCTVPAAGKTTFELGDQEVELGLGIHGEPGFRRISLEPADALVDRLLGPVFANLSSAPEDPVVLVVNNLGATPSMELAIVARRAIRVLEEKSLSVVRAYVGTFLSSLEMAGVSLSVLPVTEKQLELLDAPTDAPGWPNAANRPRTMVTPPLESTAEEPALPPPPQTPVGIALGESIQSAAEAIIQDAPRLTQLDQAVGDGDLGITLERGARAAIQFLPTFALDDPARTLHALGLTLQRALGGTSGPLYAVFFVRAADAMTDKEPTDLTAWAEAFKAGCQGISDLGGAKPGSRTMLDALIPASEAFANAVQNGASVSEAMEAAQSAAKEGAEATAQMKPRVGRSSYLGDRALGHPDPGAEAVVVWLNALLK